MYKKSIVVLSLTITAVILAAFMRTTVTQSKEPAVLQSSIEAQAQTKQASVPDTANMPEITNSTIINTNNAVIYENTVSNVSNEMRGVWVATVTNIDMPSKMNEAAFRSWASTVCQNAADRKLNTIVFQVKPTADALYNSNLAPWSKYITGGAQGTNPSYDPLKIMIESAHSRGIELHAWINPYRVTMPNEKLDSLAPNNPARLNPSWVVQYSTQYYLNPGIPEVRQYLIDSVAEIVSNYDVDAIHMDDYFYPYPVSGKTFPDNAQYKQYGQGFSNVADWRRNNVNMLVAGIYSKMKEIKPYVAFGISPFGVWRNIKDDPTGSNTTAGAPNYDSLYADTRQWIKDGTIDYLVPQIYWSRISKAANFTTLIDWWNEEVLKYAVNRPVYIYVGLADYKVGTNNDVAWQQYSTELSGQITDIRKKDALSGQIHFSYKDMIRNPLQYFNHVLVNQYTSTALPPAYYWKDQTPAVPPVSVKASVDNGIKLAITSGINDGSTRKYVIYRYSPVFGVNEASAPPEGFNNSHIAGVIYKNGNVTEFVDKSAVKGSRYKYFVKAVSSAGIENNAAVATDIIAY